jgi:hypothetical protein
VGECATIRSARNVALECRRRDRYCCINDVNVCSMAVSFIVIFIFIQVYVNRINTTVMDGVMLCVCYYDMVWCDDIMCDVCCCYLFK